MSVRLTGGHLDKRNGGGSRNPFSAQRFAALQAPNMRHAWSALLFRIDVSERWVQR